MSDRLSRLQGELSQEFPALKIFSKEACWHQRAIGKLLYLVTLGKQDAYMRRYTSTIGSSRIYTPSDWSSYSDDERYIILRHERAHLRQFRRWGLVVMGFLYIFVPLPVGLAYFRARFEQEGYSESIRASREVYGQAHVQQEAFQEWIVSQFTSGAYGWMWPFPKAVRRWVQQVASEDF